MPELSETERRIIEYLQEGRLDAEIAVRLGTSIADVKARIAALLAANGFESRAGLASATVVRSAVMVHPAESDVSPVIGGDARPAADEHEPGAARRERGTFRVAWSLGALAIAGGVAALAIWAAFGRSGDDGETLERRESLDGMTFDVLSTEDEMRMLDESIRAPLGEGAK